MPRLPFLASGLLLATTLLAVPTAPAQAADPQFCSDGRPAPCLVSILRDGGQGGDAKEHGSGERSDHRLFSDQGGTVSLSRQAGRAQ